MKKRIRELYANETSSPSSNSSKIDENLSRGDGKFYDLYVEHIIKLIKTVWIKDVPDWMVCDKDEEDKKTKSDLKSRIQFQQPLRSTSNNNYKDECNEYNEYNKDDKRKIPSHPAVCPNFWAPSLNRLNCQIVYDGYKPELDLSIGKYYERIDKGKVMEKLLAIAGIRMAAVLNTLFA